MLVNEILRLPHGCIKLVITGLPITLCAFICL
jgi:hypothetical protein